MSISIRKTRHVCSWSTKFFTHFVGVVVAVVTFALMYTVMFDRGDPIEIMDALVSPHRAPQGSIITLAWSARANRDCTGTVYRHVVSSSGIRHNYADVPVVIRNPNNLGELEMFSTQIQLPENIAPGPAYYVSRVTYVCNVFHHYFPIVIERPRREFEVIPRNFTPRLQRQT